MEYHVFRISVVDPAEAQDDLKRLCAQHRVVAVDRQFVAAGLDSFWAVCG